MFSQVIKVRENLNTTLACFLMWCVCILVYCLFRVTTVLRKFKVLLVGLQLADFILTGFMYRLLQHNQ